MAGTIAPGELSIQRGSRIQFELAEARHDREIRRLLRQKPMAGDISITLRREPNYFCGTGILRAEDHTIVATEDGWIVCMGNCSARPRWVNGKIVRVGYLGGLRLDRSVEGRFDIVRRGYKFFREIGWKNRPQIFFTSIAADNLRAIRFLERGFSGMPNYQYAGDFITIILPVKRVRRPHNDALHISPATTGDADRLASFLNQNASDLSTAWNGDQIFESSDWNLRIQDWLVCRKGEEIVGCAVLWDQRCFKQTVIENYSRRLAVARPLVNCAAAVGIGVALPKEGTVLEQAFVSPFVAAKGQENCLVPLMNTAFERAAAAGIKYLIVGFGAHDPCLSAIRKTFKKREYDSRMYTVSWDARSAPGLSDRVLSPEVALL
jgi:hypothetical protein